MAFIAMDFIDLQEKEGNGFNCELIFNLIQFKIICIALFYDTIIAK